MHEYPVTLQIIRIAEKKAREADATRVCSISLVVGDQSGFIGDSIQMYFDVIAEGTLCEGAVLDICHVRPKLRCETCDSLFERKPMSFACPVCGHDGMPTEIGKEFYIRHIEVMQG
jgi:hydrogenase nickel incorporation protein HypA/HybF